MKKNTNSIVLKNLSKEYLIRGQSNTILRRLFGFFKKKKVFIALNKINLTILKGQKVGIVGHNGAGKTTLLKIISGIATPTKGEIVYSGKVVSLIDLEAGFHLDLSGRENIILNGLITGMTSQEISEKTQSIIDFSGISEFIDSPLYTYSSGMKLRLGFSIGIHSEPDILILDEGFVAGDEKFRQKADKKFIEFTNQGKTLVIVSHWLDFLKIHCERIIWLEKGKIKEDGDRSILEKYKKEDIFQYS